MNSEEDLLSAMYAEVARRNEQYSGPYYAQVSERCIGFAIWHSETGDQVREVGSLVETIEAAHRMNAEYRAAYGNDGEE